jgi:hypothetical protein
MTSSVPDLAAPARVRTCVREGRRLALPRLLRAIERRSLAQAEAAARELEKLRLEDALGLTLLMLAERDARFERAATRWLGRLLLEYPAVGLEIASELAGSLADLAGASPDVARSRTRCCSAPSGCIRAPKCSSVGDGLGAVRRKGGPWQ